VDAAEIRAAVEGKDLDRMVAGLAEDVVVHSPVAHRPFQGVPAARILFQAILETYQDFHYVEELHGERSLGLIFKTQIGDRETHGLHHIRFTADGLADELTVMVRPLSAAQAFAQLVGPKVLELLGAAGQVVQPAVAVPGSPTAQGAAPTSA
jgi:hypothetical protein